MCHDAGISKGERCSPRSIPRRMDENELNDGSYPVMLCPRGIESGYEEPALIRCKEEAYRREYGVYLSVYETSSWPPYPPIHPSIYFSLYLVSCRLAGFLVKSERERVRKNPIVRDRNFTTNIILQVLRTMRI
jgi:hypothetical protein